MAARLSRLCYLLYAVLYGLQHAAGGSRWPHVPRCVCARVLFVGEGRGRPRGALVASGGLGSTSLLGTRQRCVTGAYIYMEYRYIFLNHISPLPPLLHTMSRWRSIGNSGNRNVIGLGQGSTIQNTIHNTIQNTIQIRIIHNTRGPNSVVFVVFQPCPQAGRQAVGGSTQQGQRWCTASR
jgi:hypothetical protein